MRRRWWRRFAECAAVCLLSGCGSSGPVTITSSVELKSAKADMSEYYLLEDSDHVFLEVSEEEALRLYEEGGSGIVFYGSSDCFYCNRAVVELNAAAKELEVSVYYVDVYRGDLTEEVRERTESYLSATYVNGRFTIPEVVAVKDGKITDSHVSLLKSKTEETLTESQKRELQKIYRDLIRSAAD